MLAAKRSGLLPILKSKSGIHVTGYVSNVGDRISAEMKLKLLTENVYEALQPVMEPDRLSKFVEPIEALAKNVGGLSAVRGNIGIFRNDNYLRVVSVPVPVTDGCFVATSFHVKPLLRWLQAECDFHFLAFDHATAHLFRGDSSSFMQISSFQFAGDDQTENGTRLLHWLRKHRGSAAPDLFVMALPDSLVSKLSLDARRNLFSDVVLSFDRPFGRESLSKTCVEIRSIFAQRAKWHLQTNLIEFSVAEDESRIAKNIFQISKAVARGEVCKLMIASGTNVFGKIDEKSGSLEIHPYDLDHEDDDVLDDLAQAVIAQGGEVIVADENQMPTHRIAMAILKGGRPVRLDQEKNRFFDQSDFAYGRVL